MFICFILVMVALQRLAKQNNDIMNLILIQQDCPTPINEKDVLICNKQIMYLFLIPLFSSLKYRNIL